MSSAQSVRADFHEGQYLGAADLDLVVNYARFQQARHALGAHTWGISAGLELKEVESPDGLGVDVLVQPGLAVDGFGRQVVVREPYQIPLSDFQEINSCPSDGKVGGRVQVWIRYDARPGQPPGPGFADCDQDELTTRVAEGFQVEVGARDHDQQHEPITVAGEEVEALEAPPGRAPDDPILCDESVPYQTFPDDAPPPRWLIPLGFVRWDPAARRLIPTDEDDRRASRACRVHVGSIAEEILAPAGLIRLRDRRGKPPEAGQALAEACAAHRLHPACDLIYDPDTGTVWLKELVWVEGKLRLLGHARLYGRWLEFRDEHGTDYLDAAGKLTSTPLIVRRVEENVVAPNAGQDLQVLLGKSDGGRNRFTVAQATLTPPDSPLDDVKIAATDLLVVQDDGKVGIGTANPTTQLGRPLTVRAAGDAQDVVGFEGSDGTPRWHVSLTPGGKDGLNFAQSDSAGGDGRLFLERGGKVGVGTTAPNAKLEVTAVPVTPFGSPLGQDRWLSVGNGGDEGRVWLEYGMQAAPLLVLSDFDDPPRIQFQQTGAGTEENPERFSWIGHARGGSPDLAVMDARLGVGTINPRDRLEVWGNIRLGPAGNLFAVAGDPNLRVVVGHVAENGTRVSGSGFTPGPPDGDSVYQVDFDPGTFSAAPVVVVTLVNPFNDDNIAVLKELTGTRFRVRTVDVAGADEPSAQDSAFTFIAIGPR